MRRTIFWANDEVNFESFNVLCALRVGCVSVDRQHVPKSGAQPNVGRGVKACFAHHQPLRLLYGDAPYLPLLLSYFSASLVGAGKSRLAGDNQASRKMHGQPQQSIPRIGWMSADSQAVGRAGRPSYN